MQKILVSGLFFWVDFKISPAEFFNRWWWWPSGKMFRDILKIFYGFYNKLILLSGGVCVKLLWVSILWLYELLIQRFLNYFDLWESKSTTRSVFHNFSSFFQNKNKKQENSTCWFHEWKFILNLCKELLHVNHF